MRPKHTACVKHTNYCPQCGAPIMLLDPGEPTALLVCSENCGWEAEPA